MASKAMLRDVVENAGAEWWDRFFQTQATQVSRRFKLARMVYWYPSERMPLDLFSYIREAALCFSVARFLATVILSSCTVELILNRDRRTTGITDFRRIGSWITLNNQNLKIAGELGLPIAPLISAGEDIDSRRPIRFVERRNKVAHGDVADMLRSLSDYDPHAEDEAYDQLIKAENYCVEWFNGAPDVQQSHIQSHTWPTDAPGDLTEDI